MERQLRRRLPATPSPSPALSTGEIQQRRSHTGERQRSGGNGGDRRTHRADSARATEERPRRCDGSWGGGVSDGGGAGWTGGDMGSCLGCGHADGGYEGGGRGWGGRRRRDTLVDGPSCRVREERGRVRRYDKRTRHAHHKRIRLRAIWQRFAPAELERNEPSSLQPTSSHAGRIVCVACLPHVVRRTRASRHGPRVCVGLRFGRGLSSSRRGWVRVCAAHFWRNREYSSVWRERYSSMPSKRRRGARGER